VDAFHDSPVLQLGLGHAADAVRAEVGIPGLNASQAAQILVALFLPFGDQVFVRQSLFDREVVELLGDGFPLVEEVVEIAGALMMDLEDGPEGFDLPLALVRFRFRFPHLLLQFVQRGFDQLPAFRRRLFGFFYFYHRGIMVGF